jgi:hypothetical protein
MRDKTLIKVFLTLLTAIIIFHLSILFKIIPYDITWGGQLQNDNEMYVFEIISISINVFLGFVLLMKGEFIKCYFRNNVINSILWIYLVLFVLNTIGNIFSKTIFEKSFSILTLIFSIFIWIILRKINNNSRKNLEYAGKSSKSE